MFTFCMLNNVSILSSFEQMSNLISRMTSMFNLILFKDKEFLRPFHRKKTASVKCSSEERKISQQELNMVLNEDSWFNEISYFESSKSVHEHVADFIEKHPEMDAPFFVSDLSEVLKKFHLWKEELPQVELYYAVKACSNNMILKVLASLGVSFDCASKSEIETVLKLGVLPEKIMYSNPFKFVSHLKYAASVGINSMVFDSEDELVKIHTYHPSAKLVIRVRPTVENNSYVNMGEKFGCTISDATILLKKARDLNSNVEGISFYVGHCTNSPIPYEDAISVARKVYNSAQEIGHMIKFVDIGGGFQGSDSRRNLFLQVAETIKKALKENFPEGIKILGEPGQFMSLTAFSVYAKVIGTRRIITKERNVQSVILSGGHYGCLSNYSFKLYTPDIELVKAVDGDAKLPTLWTKFWGPTCDAGDKITERYYQTLKMEDWLRFTEMGAYNTEIMSKFNGFEFAKIKYIAPPQLKSLLGKEATNAVK